MSEITVAEYRAGNDPENHTHKLPSVFKTGDVTLKRGIIKTNDIITWVEAVRTTGVAAKRDSVVITLLDEMRNQVATWTLRSVMPLKWTGPTLAAKGGADVAHGGAGAVQREDRVRLRFIGRTMLASPPMLASPDGRIQLAAAPQRTATLAPGGRDDRPGAARLRPGPGR